MLSLASSRPAAFSPIAAPLIRALVVGGRTAGQCQVSDHLAPRGYEIRRVPELRPGLDLNEIDVVIFALPVSRTEQVVAWCEQRVAGPVVIVLHGGGETGEVIRILEAGADDCLPAPHNPREVAARVRALLRSRLKARARYGGRHCLFDGHQLDAVNLVIRSPNGRTVEITELQQRLLSALLARAGEVVPREYLLEQVLGEDTQSFDRAIDVHVSRLKKRLALIDGSDMILSYRGVGYRLDVKEVTL